MSSERALRVVVCGTVFGQVYLEAFRQRHDSIHLAGILARGSARAMACAQHLGVPLFTRVEDLPADVNLACVVVRSRILGGSGSDLAHSLLRRGIHVLHEHPVHPDDMAEAVRIARAHRVLYRLNSFYVNIDAVRRFIGAARELRRDQKPIFVDAACGCQLSFSLLDIIATALGRARPWSFEMLPADPDDTFVTIKADFSGMPTTLRVQNQLDPADPDGFSHLLHQVTFGYAAGRLMLADTHGPVLWMPRPQFPRSVRREDSTPHFASKPASTPRVTAIGPADAASFDEIFREQWPAGVQRALLEMHHAIRNGEDPLRSAAWQLMICQLWRDLLACIGPPRLVHGGAAAPLPPGRLAEISRRVQEMETLPC